MVKRISSFANLNITQFLGTLNVDTLKLIILYFLLAQEGIGQSHKILSMINAIFVFPFLLFSPLSGILADRFSKKEMIVKTKYLELFVVLLGIFGLALGNKGLLLAIVFLLGTKEALFGPSKFGIVPELVHKEQVSKANGIITAFAFFAVISAAFCASFFLQLTDRNYIKATVVCVALALIGLYASLCIKITPPSGSQKKINIFYFSVILHSLRDSLKTPALLPAIFGAVYIFFMVSFAQLNLIQFAIHSMRLTDIAGGYLFFLTALGVAIGALIAGRISGKAVALWLVPFGALGMAFMLFALSLFSSNLYSIIVVLILLGMFIGLFQIPLESYIVLASPIQLRGQMLGLASFLGHLGVLASAGIIYVDTAVFHLNPSDGFILFGLLTTCVALFYFVKFFQYIKVSKKR